METAHPITERLRQGTFRDRLLKWLTVKIIAALRDYEKHYEQYGTTHIKTIFCMLLKSQFIDHMK